MKRRYVCAFRGARDGYQAARALAETDDLETLITDAYATPAVRAMAPWLPRSLRKALLDRVADGVPVERVRCLWETTLVEHVRHTLGVPPPLTWLKLDRDYGEAAASEAKRKRADLLMYSPYAWEAFTARYAHAPRRVLFQYHPHPALESRVLAKDRETHPEYGESFSGNDAVEAPAALLMREREAWRHADAIVCSSGFTRESLIEAGCPPDICRVVPYGVELPPAVGSSPADRFRVLFVGSGGRRKGLHHLLLAWQRASLPADAQLTLVCRAIDSSIAELAGRTQGVELLHGASAAELQQRYRTSSLFALPSLVEGFGHVYLEALAHGCPVLGTRNTALPDLGCETDGIFLADAADVEGLAARLSELSTHLSARPDLRKAARAVAERHPWSVFRSRLRDVVHS